MKSGICGVVLQQELEVDGLKCNSSCNWYSSPKEGHILGECNLAIKHGLAEVYVDPGSYCRNYKLHHEEEDRTSRRYVDYTEHYESVADACFGPKGTGGTPVKVVSGPGGEERDLLSEAHTCFECGHYDNRGETGWCAYEIHPCPAVVAIQWSLSKVAKVMLPNNKVHCACFEAKAKKCCGTCLHFRHGHCIQEGVINVPSCVTITYDRREKVSADFGKECSCYEAVNV